MKKPTISIIVAHGENLAIGKNNQLLWNIPEDLQHFKKITTGHPIIMGEKTYKSVGRPLPNRTNIVLSLDKALQIEGALVVHSMDDAIKAASDVDKKEVFFIGGGMIYQQALSFTDRLYITVVEGNWEADTYFPEYRDQFTKIISEELLNNDKNKFRFLVLER